MFGLGDGAHRPGLRVKPERSMRLAGHGSGGTSDRLIQARRPPSTTRVIRGAIRQRRTSLIVTKKQRSANGIAVEQCAGQAEADGIILASSRSRTGVEP